MPRSSYGPLSEDDMIFTLQTMLILQRNHTLILVTYINSHLATFTAKKIPNLFWLAVTGFDHLKQTCTICTRLKQITVIMHAHVAHCNINALYLQLHLGNLAVGQNMLWQVNISNKKILQEGRCNPLTHGSHAFTFKITIVIIDRQL